MTVTRAVPLLVLLAAMAVARVVYYVHGELGYDDETLGEYVQYVDPELLRHDLLESVFHLHGQPPLYNLFLGVVLKLFPAHHAFVFNLSSIAVGVVLVLAMLQLQLRLGVDRRLAVAVALLFGVSPVTALYENWLYPTYLVTALLTLAALALHRYLTEERLSDAIAFFALIAFVVLTRGFYQPFWFLPPALALLVAMPQVRRRTLLALAPPLAALVGATVLTYVQFGTWLNGEVYRDLNRAQMTTVRLPSETRESLIRRGAISPINRLEIYDSDLADYLPFVRPPARTGVAVLDQSAKSTGAPNWHSLWFRRIAEQYGRDARVVADAYPALYPSAVRSNIARFFVPADQSRPFLDMPDDHPMRRILDAWDTVTGGQLKHKGTAPLNYVTLSAALAFGLLVVGRWLRRSRPGTGRPRPSKADALTVAFMIYAFAYVALVAVLFSSNDQSRYRFEAMPLVCVLLAMFATEILRSRRRSNWTNG